MIAPVPWTGQAQEGCAVHPSCFHGRGGSMTNNIPHLKAARRNKGQSSTSGNNHLQSWKSQKRRPSQLNNRTEGAECLQRKPRAYRHGTGSCCTFVGWRGWEGHPVGGVNLPIIIWSIPPVFVTTIECSLWVNCNGHSRPINQNPPSIFRRRFNWLPFGGKDAGG